jgi:hypothetical protein
VFRVNTQPWQQRNSQRGKHEDQVAKRREASAEVVANTAISITCHQHH